MPINYDVRQEITTDQLGCVNSHPVNSKSTNSPKVQRLRKISSLVMRYAGGTSITD